jgi:hypothetical protein
VDDPDYELSTNGDYFDAGILTDYDDDGTFLHPEPGIDVQRHDRPDEFMGIRLVF